MPDKEPKELPFLGSLNDTSAMIEQLRGELAEIEKQQRELAARANEVSSKISAWNTLRQTHGLPPV